MYVGHCSYVCGAWLFLLCAQQLIASHCNALQHTLQHTATEMWANEKLQVLPRVQRNSHVTFIATHSATDRNRLQQTTTHAATHTATHCNKLQHCNTRYTPLQQGCRANRRATRAPNLERTRQVSLNATRTATNCNTHCNTRCNTLQQGCRANSRAGSAPHLKRTHCRGLGVWCLAGFFPLCSTLLQNQKIAILYFFPRCGPGVRSLQFFSFFFTPPLSLFFCRAP